MTSFDDIIIKQKKYAFILHIINKRDIKFKNKRYIIKIENNNDNR